MIFLKTNISKPVHFISAGCFTADQPWQHAQRVMDSYELILCIKGPLYMQQETKQYVLNSGDSLLLLPGVMHKGFGVSDNGTSFYWVHFDCVDAHVLKHEHQALEESALLGFNESILIPSFIKGDQFERLVVLFNQLLHISQSVELTPYSAHYMMTSLLIELSEQGTKQLKDQYVELKNEPFPKIIEWIRVHLTEEISLTKVAFEFNYSREYLSRTFKKRMGVSLQTYIHRLRLAKAKALLNESDLSVKEIAYELGFNDEKYFMKLFKRYEHITPMNYKNAYYKTHLNNR